MTERGAASGPAAGRALIFSATFGVVYGLCFYYNWPLFAYYPQVNEAHISSGLIETLGPPILWYGWLAMAGLVSAAAAFAVPRGVSDRLWHGWAWIIPAAVVVVILIYEKRWFVTPQ
jgi:NhaP-type Na+/H+ or K+/H+ antiporter